MSDARCKACGWILEELREHHPDAIVCRQCALLQPWEWWQEKRVALVGCGAEKADERRPAGDLYTSSYFDQKRRYARLACDEWAVLSAEWGVIGPECPIDPYDTTMSDHSPEERREWLESVEISVRSDVAGMTPKSELVILAGRSYVEPLSEFLETLPVQVRDPFAKTSGIGEQRAWLSDEIERHSPTKQTGLGAFAGGSP